MASTLKSTARTATAYIHDGATVISPGWVYCPRMAGQRQAGSWGLEPTSVVIDEGTSARIRTPPPGPVGFDIERPGLEAGIFGGPGADGVERLSQAVAQSQSWSKLQPIVLEVVGQYSFGLGVLYGIGENVIGSVVELGQLVKTFLLADLHDRAQRSVFAAASSPVAMLQRLIADVSMRAFASELEEARKERDELVAELRYAMTHLGEVVDGIAGSYVSK
ncbi:MAG TPA: hypothetical protein VIX63_10735 [Vicinamibacterales bacterium]